MLLYCQLSLWVCMIFSYCVFYIYSHYTLHTLHFPGLLIITCSVLLCSAAFHFSLACLLFVHLSRTLINVLYLVLSCTVDPLPRQVVMGQITAYKAADTWPTNVGQRLLYNICWQTIVGQHSCHDNHFVGQQYGGDGGLSRRRRRCCISDCS